MPGGWNLKACQTGKAKQHAIKSRKLQLTESGFHQILGSGKKITPFRAMIIRRHSRTRNRTGAETRHYADYVLSYLLQHPC